MATPNYKGTGQPSSNGGSWFASLVGGTPAYKSADKGVKASSYAGSGPAYKLAPEGSQSPAALTPTSEEESESCGVGPIAIVIPRQVIEQQ